MSTARHARGREAPAAPRPARAPRHARARAGRQLRALPAGLMVTGLVMVGSASWLGTAGAAPAEPPTGLTVADVRQPHRAEDAATVDGAAGTPPSEADAAAVDVPATPDAEQSAAGTPDAQQAAAETSDAQQAAAEPAPPAEPPPPPPPVVHQPVAVSVPSLDLRAPLIDLGLDARGKLEVPADPDVAGWWTGGPAPGEHGAAVLAGHVDSNRGPGVFWGLAGLVPGDRIVVHGQDGTSVEFVVDGVGRWPKDAFPTDAVYREAAGPELRLITCGGEFDRRARSYRDNVVVFATVA